MTTRKELMYQALALGLVTISVYYQGCLRENTYQRAYKDGYDKAQVEWREALIDADFAEYDRRTGYWKFRSMEDIMMIGTVLGQAPITGIYPEPPVTKEDVKFILAKKNKTKSLK